MMYSIRLFLIKALTLITCATAVNAEPILITDIRQNDSGRFHHSLFHTASALNGQSGQILSRLELNPFFDNHYDPDTGQLQASINIVDYIDSHVIFGTGVVSSDDLLGSRFTGSNSGQLIGTLDWVITLDSLAGPNLFHDYMLDNFSVRNGLITTTMSIHDTHFVTSSEGFTANSLELGALGYPEAMTIWAQTNDSTYDCPQGELGMDLVFQMSSPPYITTPEPATWVMLVLVGLLAVTRQVSARKKKGVIHSGE